MFCGKINARVHFKDKRFALLHAIASIQVAHKRVELVQQEGLHVGNAAVSKGLFAEDDLYPVAFYMLARIVNADGGKGRARELVIPVVAERNFNFLVHVFPPF